MWTATTPTNKRTDGRAPYPNHVYKHVRVFLVQVFVFSFRRM